MEGDKIDKKKAQKIDAQAKQQRALQDFFRDTGGKVTDLRVLRSAMFLSDEIDRAVRGVDQEQQYVGWRPYNRFYAQGTEDMFTNVPAGKSPLVMASPKQRLQLMSTNALPHIDKQSEVRRLPVEYQAVRRSHLRQVGRAIDQITQSELLRLDSLLGNDQIKNKLTREQLAYIAKRKQTASEEDASSSSLGGQDKRKVLQTSNVPRYIEPVVINTNEKNEPSQDLRIAVHQPYDPKDNKPMKNRLMRFEGELNERRPDLEYKFEELE